VDDLINQLYSVREDMCENIQTFWDQLHSQEKGLSRNDIIKLFFGGNKDGENSKQGLLYHCGIIDENVLGAEKCLSLVAKLVDYEMNSDCESYISALKLSKKEQIESMKLDRHLNSNKSSVITNALKIMKVLATNSERFADVKSFVKTPENIEKYVNFVLSE